MLDKVVDASAIAAVLFNEPDSAKVAARLDECRLLAPPLLAFELASVCLGKSRRQPERRESLQQWFSRRGRFGIETVDVDMDEAEGLALATGLSAYDASYLWLARALGAELVTLDKQLARAAAAS